MEMTKAELKMLYMIAPISLFVGIDGQKQTLIVGGIASFAWILSRWVGPWRVVHVKTTVCND